MACLVIVQGLKIRRPSPHHHPLLLLRPQRSAPWTCCRRCCHSPKLSLVRCGRRRRRCQRWRKTRGGPGLYTTATVQTRHHLRDHPRRPRPKPPLLHLCLIRTHPNPFPRLGRCLRPLGRRVLCPSSPSQSCEYLSCPHVSVPPGGRLTAAGGVGGGGGRLEADRLGGPSAVCWK